MGFRTKGTRPKRHRSDKCHRPAGLLILFLVACGCEKKKPERAALPVPSAQPCADGKSVDPPVAELRPATTAAEAKNYASAQRMFEGLAGRYPESATLRVWLGYVVLFAVDEADDPAYRTVAERALQHYKQAEALHDRGCRLPERDHYYLRLDGSLAELRLKNADAALRQLEIAKRAWPNSPDVSYNRARAFCMKGLVDPCVEEFEQTLVLAKSLQRPLFLRTHHTVDDWVVRSRTQSEFGPLRADRRFLVSIEKYTRGK